MASSNSVDHAISGFLAGLVSTLLLHPMDVLKVKMQITETRPLLKQITTNIYRNQGLIGFYRGISPSMAGSCLSWGIYFYLYQSFKNTFDTTKQLSPLEHLSASGLAGLITALFANPLFVIKTRMITQTRQDGYKSLLHGFKTIYKNEGVPGLYRGLVPAMFGVSHGAIQFMFYEQMKIYTSDSPTMLEYTVLASISKVIATVLTYPYQTLKSRLQTESKYLTKEYSGVMMTVRNIYGGEGFRGFYKGLGINLVRVLPGTIVTFGVYEFCAKQFKTIREARDESFE
jgi:solute carrier family 25 (mitochondrial folate transporter), member 32